ncbi:MAG: PIN domain-containing protein [Solirubrobacteraceae bacterium]
MWLETSTGPPPRSSVTGGSGSLSDRGDVEPVSLGGPALFDTGVWTWARDRRFPQLASWFNAQVAAGRVLVCDLVVLELVRLTPNESRAREVAARLGVFESVPMPAKLWARARSLQVLLSAEGDHRRVPPADLLIGAAAEAAGVPIVHYDRDYERLARAGSLDARWLVPDGALAPAEQRR